MVRLLCSSILVLLVSGLVVPVNAAEALTPHWGVTVYRGVLSGDTLNNQLVGGADYDSDFQYTALALSRLIPNSAARYDLEWELQMVDHGKGQSHQELNGLLALRWKPLPWDGYLNTDIALGAGLSYATRVPSFEARHHSSADRLLAYLLIELELRPDSWEDWSLVVRSHHRSGSFGLFNGVHGASNSLGLGIKHRF